MSRRLAALVIATLCVSALAAGVPLRRRSRTRWPYSPVSTRSPGGLPRSRFPVNEVRRFGALNVYPRICNTRPPTEEPKTTSFVQVDEALQNGGTRRIFSGWMLAESPGLNAVEHPVYDVWLIGCRDPNQAAEEAAKPVKPSAAARRRQRMGNRPKRRAQIEAWVFARYSAVSPHLPVI
jgi:hypothetical protein